MAQRIVQELRQRCILTGTDGPDDNVIKIKPPLVVPPEDVDRFALDLDEILAQLKPTVQLVLEAEWD